MTKTTDLHIQIDPEIKSNAEHLFSTFGITISEAVNMFLHQSVFVGGLPFELRQPRYNAETENAIQEARDMISGKIRGKVYVDLSDFYNDLESEYDFISRHLERVERYIKQAAWKNFKRMVKESAHENHLLEGDIFTRQDSGRELLNFTDGADEL